jgi:L-lysine exporter family protein LysE/ArgO
MWHLPVLKGCFTTAGLIIAIGAQNAFVLKQGLMRNQVFATALFCSVADALLILLGVGGFGALMTSNQFLLFIAKWGGASFLFWYGFKAFRSIFHAQSLDAQDAKGPFRPTLKETAVTLTAVTFLNPHVYLDTVVLLGSIGSQYETQERPLFALGAILASLFWFFGLCYGARLLAPVFKKQVSWKVLDFFVGCTMWYIAFSLLFSRGQTC